MHRTILAFLILSSWTAEATAQPVVDFGGEVPCQDWLSNQAAAKERSAWILGFWSGLNAGAAMRQDDASAGKTLSITEALGRVMQVCQEKPSLRLSFAAATAWARAKLQRR